MSEKLNQGSNDGCLSNVKLYPVKTAQTKVSVCVATYKRPSLLQNLLKSLNNLVFTQIPTPIVEIIIVDNDSSGSAKTTVQAMRPAFKWLLKYFIEPNQGVTYARNRTVAEASKDSNFIAMLDDDEIATPQWLEALLINQQKFDAPIVRGPSLPTFHEEQQVPHWIKAGNFHTPPRYKTGHKMDTAFTSNVMFSTKLLQNFQGNDSLFNHRFAHKGAEDVYLFSSLNKQGHKIIWSDDAVLYESIADERLSLRWLLNRGFWSWSCHSLIESELYPSLKTRLIRGIKGLGLITIGSISIGPSIFLGKDKVAWSLLRVCRGMGTFAGLFGYQGNWR